LSGVFSSTAGFTILKTPASRTVFSPPADWMPRNFCARRSCLPDREPALRDEIVNGVLPKSCTTASKPRVAAGRKLSTTQTRGHGAARTSQCSFASVRDVRRKKQSRSKKERAAKLIPLRWRKLPQNEGKKSGHRYWRLAVKLMISQRIKRRNLIPAEP